MGCHTWFHKDKDVYFKYTQLEEQEGLSEEIFDELYDRNSATKEGFHDLFRTDKRQFNGEYPEDVLISYKEAIEWIENSENKVTFAYSILDTPEEIEMHKKTCYGRLKEFWSKHPNGLIDFG